MAFEFPALGPPGARFQRRENLVTAVRAAIQEAAFSPVDAAEVALVATSLNGDGTTVTFTLTEPASSQPGMVLVHVDGLMLPLSDYAVEADQITFATAPTAGAAIEVMAFGAYPGHGGDGGAWEWVGTVDPGLIAADPLQAVYRQPEGSIGAWVRRRDPGELWVEWFGAVGDSTSAGDGSDDDATDCTAAFQAAVDFARETGAPATINIGTGAFKISDEIEHGGLTHPVVWRGRGRNATFISPTPFGAGKAIFKFDGSDSIYCGVEQLTFRRLNSHKAHPICVFVPLSGRNVFRSLASSGIGNTIIWASRAFNTDWTDMDFYFCGYAPVWKEVPTSITLSFTAGNPVVTASEAVFTPADVGKQIVISLTPPDQGNEAWTTTIASYSSSTSVTLQHAPDTTRSGRRFSFTAVRGSMTAAGTTLTAEKAIFDADDVGRWVYLPAAGPERGLLAARVVEVLSDTEVTLDTPAVNTVSNRRIHFSPAIYLGPEPGLVGSTPINDVKITRFRIEGFRGPGIIIDRGTHVYLTHMKTHGRAWLDFSNFGATGEALIVSGTRRMIITDWELEFCVGNLAPIEIVGAAPILNISSMTASAPCYGYQWLMNFDPNDISRDPALHIGSVQAVHDWGRYAGLINVSDAARARRVYRYGPTTGGNNSSMATPLRSLPSRFIEDDAAFSFEAPATAVLLLIAATDSPTWSALVHVRFTNSNTAAMIIGDSGDVGVHAGGTLLTGTTGSDGKLNISAGSDGRVYVENRTGGGRTFLINALG